MKNGMKMFLDIFGTTFFAGCGVLSILAGIGTIKNSIDNSEVLSGLISLKGGEE